MVIFGTFLTLTTMPHAIYFVKIYSGMHEKTRSEEKRFKIIGLLTTKKLKHRNENVYLTF